MSGTVGLRARKQWQIQGGPHGTLRRLRNQLAEDGCVESQVVIAKQLLEEAQNGGDWTESTTQAVHWLTRASECGNDEAAALLKSCLESGMGITEENIDEVKTCLRMSRDEKAFRAAARDLFNSLTPFGQEFVTTCQLRAKTTEGNTKRAACDEPSSADASENDSAARNRNANSSFNKWYEDAGLFDGQHLTEEKLVDIAARVAQGELPVESLDNEESSNVPYQTLPKKAFARLKQSTVSSSGKVLGWIAQYGDKFLLSLLPLSQLRTLALVLLCTVLPFDTLFYVLPMIAFYTSLSVMLISTLQILHNRKKFETFVLWLQIFNSAKCDLHTLCAEGKFCHRRLRPYVHFFVALLIFVSILPLASAEAIFHSELVALSAGLSVLCLVRFNTSTLQVWIFATTALLLTALRTLHALGMASFLFVGPKFDVTEQLAVHVSVICLPAGGVLLISFWMAAKESWHGSYKTLLPNVVALSWLQLIVTFVPMASPSGILRGILVWGTVIVLPLACIVVVVCVSAAYSATWLAGFLYGATNPLPLFTALGCLAATVAGKWFVERRENMGKGTWKRWMTGIQILCGIYAILQLVPSVTNWDLVAKSDCRSTAASIDWHTYHGLCHSPAWSERTMANVQELCSHLTGASVRWSGLVKSVKISKIQNRLEEMLGFLPETVGQHLRCVYGVPYGDCNRDEVGEREYGLCTAIKLAGHRKCHVNQWNLYDFEVSIQMSGGYWNSADVIVVADNSFKDFVFHLNAGDEIQFTGLLHANIGGWQPKVWLKTASCENCVYDMKPVTGKQQVNVNEEFGKILNFVFNYFFYPFVELRLSNNQK